MKTKKFKKIAALSLSSLMMFSIGACGEKTIDPTIEDRIVYRKWERISCRWCVPSARYG